MMQNYDKRNPLPIAYSYWQGDFPYRVKGSGEPGYLAIL